MRKLRHNTNKLVATGLMVVVALSGCNKPSDEASGTTAPAEAAVASTASAVTATESAPSIDELKMIAEEGFIYGLPLVMNYAVMNEYAVDPNSSQYKAPFN